jgi:hypothetical protein
MSLAIFVMIIAWGGILQSKPWAKSLEAFRLVTMSVLFLSVLERHNMIEWTGWAVIFTALWCGGSILWLSMKMARAEAKETAMA